jgi:hypothetical protein
MGPKFLLAQQINSLKFLAIIQVELREETRPSKQFQRVFLMVAVGLAYKAEKIQG